MIWCVDDLDAFATNVVAHAFPDRMAVDLANAADGNHVPHWGPHTAPMPTRAPIRTISPQMIISATKGDHGWSS